MANNNHIVIIGHSGFVGSHIVRFLKRTDSFNITGYSYPEIDLTNMEQARKVTQYFSTETTVVLAAAVKRQFGDNLESFRQNMLIVENFCKLLEENPVRKVIFMSSAAVYGEETENINISEDTAVNPTSYYGIAKYTSERLLTKVCTLNSSTSLVCLRPPLIYGANDPGQTYGPSGFSAAALAGKPITLWGDGTELREFMYVEDICQIVQVLIENDYSGILNAASGQSYSFADILTILRQTFPALEVNSRIRSKQKADNAFNATKIKALLPDTFKFTSLRDGLKQMLL